MEYRPCIRHTINPVLLQVHILLALMAFGFLIVTLVTVMLSLRLANQWDDIERRYSSSSTAEDRARLIDTCEADKRTLGIDAVVLGGVQGSGVYAQLSPVFRALLHPVVAFRYLRSVGTVHFLQQRDAFQRRHELPPHFSYATYLRKCKQHSFQTLVEVPLSAWAILGFVTTCDLFVRSLWHDYEAYANAAAIVSAGSIAIIAVAVAISWKISSAHWKTLHGFYESPQRAAAIEPVAAGAAATNARRVSKTLARSASGRQLVAVPNSERRVSVYSVAASAPQGKDGTQGRLPPSPAELFWFGSPTFLLRMMQSCMLASALLVALTVRFWYVWSGVAGPDGTDPWSPALNGYSFVPILVAVAVSTVLLLLHYVVPLYIVVLHSGDAVDLSLLIEAVQKQRQLEKARRRMERAKALHAQLQSSVGAPPLRQRVRTLLSTRLYRQVVAAIIIVDVFLIALCVGHWLSPMEEVRVFIGQTMLACLLLLEQGVLVAMDKRPFERFSPARTHEWGHNAFDLLITVAAFVSTVVELALEYGRTVSSADSDYASEGGTGLRISVLSSLRVIRLFQVFRLNCRPSLTPAVDTELEAATHHHAQQQHHHHSHHHSHSKEHRHQQDERGSSGGPPHAGGATQTSTAPGVETGERSAARDLEAGYGRRAGDATMRAYGPLWDLLKHIQSTTPTATITAAGRAAGLTGAEGTAFAGNDAGAQGGGAGSAGPTMSLTIGHDLAAALEKQLRILAQETEHGTVRRRQNSGARKVPAPFPQPGVSRGGNHVNSGLSAGASGRKVAVWDAFQPMRDVEAGATGVEEEHEEEIAEAGSLAPARAAQFSDDAHPTIRLPVAGALRLGQLDTEQQHLRSQTHPHQPPVHSFSFQGVEFGGAFRYSASMIEHGLAYGSAGHLHHSKSLAATALRLKSRQREQQHQARHGLSHASPGGHAHSFHGGTTHHAAMPMWLPEHSAHAGLHHSRAASFDEGEESDLSADSASSGSDEEDARGDGCQSRDPWRHHHSGSGIGSGRTTASAPQSSPTFALDKTSPLGQHAEATLSSRAAAAPPRPFAEPGPSHLDQPHDVSESGVELAFSDDAVCDDGLSATGSGGLGSRGGSFLSLSRGGSFLSLPDGGNLPVEESFSPAAAYHDSGSVASQSDAVSGLVQEPASTSADTVAGDESPPPFSFET